MKLNYYSYWINDGNKTYRQSILPLVNAFISAEPAKIAKAVPDAGSDYLLIYPLTDDIFLFAMTKDRELIKAVSKDMMAYEDIQKKLNDDHVAFATYIYLRDDFYGMAGTFYGPKNRKWEGFVNYLLELAGKRNCNFYSSPFPRLLNKEQAENFMIKGKTIFKLRKGHPLFNAIAQNLGGCDDAFGLEVKITPSRNKDMPETYSRVLEAVCSDAPNVEKLMVSAKEDVADKLQDWYIIGNGFISDDIESRSELGICSEIKAKCRENWKLKSKLAEQRNDKEIEQNGVPNFDSVRNLDTWRSHPLGF